MFCYQCGAQIEDGLAFCTNCGAKLTNEEPARAAEVWPAQETVQPVVLNTYGQNDAANEQQELASPARVGFVDAIKLFFKNYANFTGRSTASEYWWAWLFNYIVSFVLAYVPVVGTIASLALLVPGIAITVRRLHDTGKAWTYLFMGLIPLAGPIILIVRYCKASDGENQWGPAPKN